MTNTLSPLQLSPPPPPSEDIDDPLVPLPISNSESIWDSMIFNGPMIPFEKGIKRLPHKTHTSCKDTIVLNDSATRHNPRPKKRGFFANHKNPNTNTTNCDLVPAPPRKKIKLQLNRNLYYQENVRLKRQNAQLMKKANEYKNAYDTIHQKVQQNRTQISDLKRSYNGISTKYIKGLQTNKEQKKALESIKEVIVSKNKLQINVSNPHALELNELNELEKNLAHSVSVIREIKDKLIENKYLCIICCQNERNIAFQGCNHVVVCDECEDKLETKRCPVCQQIYIFVNKLHYT